MLQEAWALRAAVVKHLTSKICHCQVLMTSQRAGPDLDQGQVALCLSVAGLDHGILLLEGVVGLVDLLAVLPLHRQVGCLLVQVSCCLHQVSVLLHIVLDGTGGNGHCEGTQYESAGGVCEKIVMRFIQAIGLGVKCAGGPCESLMMK